MIKIVYVILVSSILGFMGNMWWENRQEVDRLKQEFTEYRKQTNEKLKVLDSLQKEINDIRSNFVSEQNQAIKDAVRGDIVAKKPKLVEPKLNESFKELTKEIKEITQ